MKKEQQFWDWFKVKEAIAKVRVPMNHFPDSIVTQS